MCESIIIISYSTLLGFERMMRLNYINCKYTSTSTSTSYNNNNISLVPRSMSIGMQSRTSITFNPHTHKLCYTKASAAADDVIQQQEEERAADDADSRLQLDDYEIKGTQSDGLNSDSPIVRRKRQTMNRSSILAKQVITIHSAITLGFVSQLWLDTSSWLVLVVELRPNLLSAQAQRFLLHHIHQVGDVVLIQDESVTEDEIKMVGLETLVGYDVVTPGRQNIGKVRGYNFNVNSGAVISLELDSFGFSIIPSSLVSTYVLFVEDVLEVVLDTVVVHEAAASRIQRLTKGFWDAQKAMKSFSDLENPVQPEYNRRRPRSSTSKNLQSEVGEMDVNWELPMDYL